MAAPGTPERNAHLRVRPSLLDRLLIEENAEPYPSAAKQLRTIKEAVRRDLEWLLNSRFAQKREEWQALPEDLRRSVYSFGLPDFSGMSASSAHTRRELEIALQAAIETHEPRISQLSVECHAEESREKRSASEVLALRFVISGTLLVDPEPEPIAYSAVLEVNKSEYQVREE